MISIIIPTLWKGKEILYMLPILLKHGKVGEVIIIDNNKKARPHIAEHKKLKIFEQKENIYVNPAWNLGVSKAKYSKICLMNDDIVFDESVFDLVYSKITEFNGVIGPSHKGIKNFFVKSPLKSLVAVKERPMDNFFIGWGTLMFFHKQSYVEIPKEYLIYYGDIYLYEYNAIQKRQNYNIDKLCVCTKMNLSSEMFKNITDNEHNVDITLKIFKNLHENYTKDGEVLSEPFYVIEELENVKRTIDLERLNKEKR